jgi:hypothetical protein
VQKTRPAIATERVQWAWEDLRRGLNRSLRTALRAAVWPSLLSGADRASE